jgi:hypothetical protein
MWIKVVFILFSCIHQDPAVDGSIWSKLSVKGLGKK